jgi:hypothetical protein
MMESRRQILPAILWVRSSLRSFFTSTFSIFSCCSVSFSEALDFVLAIGCKDIKSTSVIKGYANTNLCRNVSKPVILEDFFTIFKVDGEGKAASYKLLAASCF